MKCFNCDTELVWQQTFTFEDYTLEGDGIVTVLMCPECNTIWEGYQSFEDEENN